MENFVLILIGDLNNLVVLLEHELRTLDLSMLVKVWQYEHFIEGLLASELRHI